MTGKIRLYIILIAGAAAALLTTALLRLDFHDPLRLLGYLLIAVLSSTFKVRIPGLEGVYSLNFLVVLAAVSELGLAELMMVSAACAVVQSYWLAIRKPRLEQVVFNVSNLVISVAGAYGIFHLSDFWPNYWRFLSTLLAALGYYMLNTGMTAIVLALVQGEGFRQVWNHWTLYTLPYYLLGSTLAAAWTFCDPRARLQAVLLSILLLCVIYRLFRNFVSSQIATEHRPGR